MPGKAVIRQRIPSFRFKACHPPKANAVSTQPPQGITARMRANVQVTIAHSSCGTVNGSLTGGNGAGDMGGS